MKNNKVVSGFLWKFAEKCGSQGVSLIVSIVLARLLSPDVYGVIALVTVVISIMQVFVDSGLGNALIQKKNVDSTDFSTVFFFNIAMCLLIYIIVFFMAPYVAMFYNKEELTLVLRVLSLTVIISAVKNVQQAYIARRLMFKKFFIATLGGTIIAAILGISMAYMGFGIWALVVQNLANNLIGTIILWVTVKWRPELRFSFKSFKRLFSYGSRLLASSLIDVVYRDLRQLIIGKMYTSESLAYYNKGEQFPKLLATNINTSVDSVLLPVMSKEQDNSVAVKEMTRKSIRHCSYILWPLMIGLCVCANAFVRILLTDKWISCVPFLQVFCITYAFYPINSANLSAIKALGRSDIFLRLEIIKKFVGVCILLISMWFGPLVMAYSLLVSNITSQIINSWPNRKLLNYSYIEKLKDIMPTIGLAGLMGIIVYAITCLKLNVYLEIIVQIIVGALVYILGSIIFKIDSFNYILNILKGFLKKNK